MYHKRWESWKRFAFGECV